MMRGSKIDGHGLPALDACGTLQKSRKSDSGDQTDHGGVNKVLSALRQKADHRVGKGVRLFDIGNMRGVENRQAGAGNLAADELA
jgi:hypothetical protein